MIHSLEIHGLARHLVSKHSDIYRSVLLTAARVTFVSCIIIDRVIQSHACRTLFLSKFCFGLIRYRLRVLLNVNAGDAARQLATICEFLGSRAGKPWLGFKVFFKTSVTFQNQQPSISLRDLISQHLGSSYPNHVSYFHCPRLGSWIWNNYRFRWSRV